MNLKQYIRGGRRGKAARDLEKEALNDPFLNDAIDGYDAVPGDHSRHLENLHRKVSRSSLERADFRRLAGLVAGLLILFTINFFFNRKEEVEITAMDTTAGQAEAVWADTGKNVETEIVPPLIAEAKERETEQKVRSDDEIRKAHNTPVIRQKNKESVVEESLAMNTDVASEDEVRLADEPVEEIKVMAMSKYAVAAARPLANAAHEATGIVTDKSGSPLAGVAVQIKNSKKGVVTGSDGRFSIPVSGKDSLQFSFVGFETTSICADPNSPMSIVLSESPMTLSESVIVKSADLEPVMGWREFRKYLKREMRLPADTCRNISGKVSLTFEIDGQGHPINIKIRKSLCPSLDREAMRLLKSGPIWQGNAKVGQVDIRFE
ncbi:carboxypeptidase-like regulatory domain-containing protein [Coprobacter sp.]|uniref:energy transducer TonB n=1 Tax=Coprobacter sp. TaxID=1941478 RepID=UPI003AB1780C